LYQTLLAVAKFHEQLLAFDRDLAARRRAAGCPDCGGALHSANYRRKPRGQLRRRSFFRRGQRKDVGGGDAGQGVRGQEGDIVGHAIVELVRRQIADGRSRETGDLGGRERANIERVPRRRVQCVDLRGGQRGNLTLVPILYFMRRGDTWLIQRCSRVGVGMLQTNARHRGSLVEWQGVPGRGGPPCRIYLPCRVPLPVGTPALGSLWSFVLAAAVLSLSKPSIDSR